MGQVRRVCSIALAIAFAACGQSVMPTPRRVVLFALEQQPNGSFFLEPLFAREKGLLQMPSMVDPGTNCRAFPSEYTRAGTSYGLLFGGARAGTATLEGGGKVAVSFTRAVRLSQGQMALATELEGVGPGNGVKTPAHYRGAGRRPQSGAFTVKAEGHSVRDAGAFCHRAVDL